MKKIAILQSNYIPWKGYFDMIDMVDEFIILDTVQYTKNDWRNRNLIKTNSGTKWLTIPCYIKSLNQLINETLVSDNRWTQKHFKTLESFYSKSKYFKAYKDIFKNIYNNINTEYLSEINEIFIKEICNILNIKTILKQSHEFELNGDKTDKLITICKQCNANIYLSGPAAKNYLDVELMNRNNIKVEWMSYDDYIEYEQLYPPFDHYVSIIDLIFNEGPNAFKFLKSNYKL